ncbi:[FeFe] hydrogenase H-cluster radical SAM maturase HydG [Thioalkalicoccus limnaeus]|uniref:[FeFe] hydrogenase H-cluster radical SAM maturase HydG n=1 Tax=Thioalkalicoccus limnaeus TaxID=120681 RepID=A0ABV4BFH3_9GAMM
MSTPARVGRGLSSLPVSRTDTDASWLDAEAIAAVLADDRREEAGRVREILAKARELGGLTIEDVAALIQIQDPALLDELFVSARWVKEAIYGKRIVLFAPLYISNLCGNACSYCAFSKDNTALKRRALSLDEIEREAEVLIAQGHKRLLLVAGESYPNGLRSVLDALEAIYALKIGSGEIRRINVNLAPLSVEEFRQLHAIGIGTYQLFQETYQRDLYAAVHLAGRKRDMDWRLTAPDRAMQAGIDDIGLGVLLGLGDWRFDVLALMAHAAHLEATFGAGCHTISVPRIEPAHGSLLSQSPLHPVSDADFKKLVAILRLAVPYTGLIMSTRETAQMRRATYALGVSQISAGSRTNPGGYAAHAETVALPDEGALEDFDASQFSLGDHRPLDEVVRELAELGYTPSFCTACYRNGRTGEDFMHWAKSADIKAKCGPNSVGTFMEYLLDYAQPETVLAGEAAIARDLAEMADADRRVANLILDRVRHGKRDVFC